MTTLPLALCLWLLASPANAETQDAVLEGYQQVYAGRPEDATGHFNRLRARDQQALGPWFGALFATVGQLEYDDTLEAPFEQSLDTFIDEASARYRRSPQDAEALFYLAQAHMLRGTHRVSNDKGMWGAARDGARAKSLADEYIKRHPEHGDAYLALGLYNYFVDIAPNFVKVLRVLLFLPAGDRTVGLEQLRRAAKDGSYFAPFALTVLAEIYGSLEGRPRESIPLLETFLQRFPENGEVRLDIAAMYMHPTLEQFSRAEEQFTTVLSGATASTPRQLSLRHSATLGLAGLRRAQWRLPEAIDLLNRALATAPRTPEWIHPALLLRRGNYKMLVNDPTAADDLRLVLKDELGEWHDAARQLIDAEETRRRRNEGPVYAELIPGNRLVAEDRFDEARRVYQTVAARHPNDWQVRYRFAYLEFAAGRYQDAAAAMQAIVASADTMPGWVKASALLHLAYTHDLAGRRDEAVKLYRRIVEKHENDGSAGAARVGLIAPYRR